MQSFMRPAFGTLLKPQCRVPVTRLIQSTNSRAGLYSTSAFARQKAFNLKAGRVASKLALGVGTVGLGLAMYPKLNCEPGPPALGPRKAVTPPPVEAKPAAPSGPPPKSSVDPYQLTFGTVCGICAGVFVKKGVKTLAFILGGVFVLLQYFSSTSIIRVDWSKAASKYEKRFHTQPVKSGDKSQPPTVYAFFNWFVDFLTADFPPRATFLAGFILGLRLG